MSALSIAGRQDAAVAREVALRGALGHLEREFGKGTLMRMGDPGAQVRCEAIPTGALSLDLALGIGGVPRGRIVEVYGPESSGKTTLVYHVLAEAQKLGGVCAFIDAEHAMDPVYAREIGVDIDELLFSQPDYGEQALEIADVLVRSGAVDEHERLQGELRVLDAAPEPPAEVASPAAPKAVPEPPVDPEPAAPPANVVRLPDRPRVPCTRMVSPKVARLMLAPRRPALERAGVARVGAGRVSSAPQDDPRPRDVGEELDADAEAV